MTVVTAGGTVVVLAATGTTGPLDAVSAVSAGTLVAGEAPVTVLALDFGSAAVVAAVAAALLAGPPMATVLDALAIAIEAAAVCCATWASVGEMETEEEGLATEFGGEVPLAVEPGGLVLVDEAAVGVELLAAGPVAAGSGIEVAVVPGSFGVLLSGAATAGGPGVGAVASVAVVEGAVGSVARVVGSVAGVEAAAGSTVTVEVALGSVAGVVAGPAVKGAVALAPAAGVSASAADDPAQLRISAIRQRSAKRRPLCVMLRVPRGPSRRMPLICTPTCSPIWTLVRGFRKSNIPEFPAFLGPRIWSFAGTVSRRARHGNSVPRASQEDSGGPQRCHPLTCTPIVGKQPAHLLRV